MSRNVFQAFNDDELPETREPDDVYEPDDGSDSEGEEFNYTYPPDEDLPDDDLDSDEEYVLTEMGPVAFRFTEDYQPSTSANPDIGEPHDQRLRAKDGTLWSITPPANQKTPSKNIFRPAKTRHSNCNGMSDPTSAFNLFISPNIIRDIVKFTNLEGQRMDGGKWMQTDEIEIKALIGCFIHLGAMNQSMFPSELIWDVKCGNPMARSVFTRNRFLKLSNRLRFDDKETRTERRERDAFAPIRDLWERFQSNLRRYYTPGPFITVDEQLYPWRGRCSFLQYLPSKPDKYGLKVFWACDAETMFPLVGKPYLGKVGRTPQVNLGRNTALELCEPFFGSGRNLTCDSFFTDMELCKALSTEKLTMVGTLRRNKVFIPPEFQDPKQTEKGKPRFAFRKGSMLVSYKSGQKKNVIVLSSMHSDAAIVPEKGEKNLPEV
ncbi:PiggyBac transposable element-derived protein 4, partial [Plakobranchus ocellatus]